MRLCTNEREWVFEKNKKDTHLFETVDEEGANASTPDLASATSDVVATTVNFMLDLIYKEERIIGVAMTRYVAWIRDCGDRRIAIMGSWEQ